MLTHAYLSIKTVKSICCSNLVFNKEDTYYVFISSISNNIKNFIIIICMCRYTLTIDGCSWGKDSISLEISKIFGFFFVYVFVSLGFCAFGIVIENNEGGARYLISCPFPLLQSKKLFFTLPYPKLLHKPLGNGCLVDM